ncbi:trigger factor [Shimazuella sp. AN120528]|uniref:trigger factor n=1 Tax=Shimazuella soli TaxID=1892854 RepID=UPI001F10D06B|nr:trigger factor [Shimazuella soli]MCH5584650.1 trigger factor [Shimazuella soli]
MTASFVKNDNNQVVLTVEAPEEKVSQALDQAFKKVVKKVNVPGFRKGKIPRQIFEKRFGVESLYQDALDILLPEAYENAIKETGIEPVDRPEVDVEQLEKGKSLIFTATVTVKPEVKLGEYKGIEIEEKDFSVTEEAVNEELQKMQKQQATLEPVESGEVENGDTVVIDFEGFVDGVAFEGGKGENYSLEIGSNTFIPGFEEQLIGLGLGEEKDVDVTFPEDYRATDLAGKPATFRVKLHEIKRLNLPELDDEFAQDVSEKETLAELKQDLEHKLEERLQKEEEEYIRNQVVEVASNNAEVDIPEAMINHEVDHMYGHFVQNLGYQGLNIELYTQLTGQSESDIKAQMKEDASKKVRADLVIEAISHAENVEVSEEEVEEEIVQTAKEMNRDVEEVKDIINKQGNIESLRESLKRKKTIDLLVLNRKNTA